MEGAGGVLPRSMRFAPPTNQFLKLSASAALLYPRHSFAALCTPHSEEPPGPGPLTRERVPVQLLLPVALRKPPPLGGQVQVLPEAHKG